MKTYRNNGAIGALLDEYERALLELKEVIIPLSNEQMTTIVDTITKDEDCKSIQTILAHIISSGYNYAIETRNWLDENVDYKKSKSLNSVSEYVEELDNMFTYNVQLFSDYPNLKLEEKDNEKKILVKWEQHYDVDQLYEHAIVHILRHRRQIERFIIRLDS